MTKKEENANKRLIFYFTSRVLFMIIAIILISSWCCMFVHADGSFRLSDYYGLDMSKLNPNVSWNNDSPRPFWNRADYEYCLSTYDHPISTDYTPMTLVGLDNNNIRVNWDDSIISHLDFDSYYPLFCHGDVWDRYCIICIPKEIIDNQIAVFTVKGFYSTEDFDYTYALGPGIFGGDWEYNTATFDSSTVHHIDLSNQAGSQFCYSTPIPIFNGLELTGDPPSSTFENILADSLNVDSVVDQNAYNVNYFLWDDITSINIGGNDQESAKNHLFLKDFQIGLTGSDSGIDIVQSNLVCGVTCGDNYQVNNINDFNLRVTVSLGCSTSSVNVPDFVGSKQYDFPLATFTSKTFDYSMYDIFRDIDSTGVGNFLNYYNTYLKPSTSTVAIRNVPYENYTGLFPTIANQVYKYLIGSYKYVSVQTSEAPQIDELTMGVTINLVDNKGNLSGSGTKVFNFLSGTNSVTSADILRNNDPWEGESEYPDVDPNAPSGSGVSNSSGGATAIAYGGNTTINVNNSNGLQNNVINGQDPEETQNIIDRYTDVLGQFKQDISSMSSIGTSEENGFLSLLIDTYSFIPGLSYIALSCGVIFGLCVILFIIKVLLF